MNSNESQSEPRAWISYAPALLLSILALSVATALGGVIALAIAAFIALPALLSSAVITLLVRLRYKPQTPAQALMLGSAIFLVTLGIVYLLIKLSGPTQIM